MSTDIRISGKAKDIKTGLMPKDKRHFVKIIKEKNKNERFNKKKTNCQSLTKIILHNEINKTGIEEKNKGGLFGTLSIKKNSNKLKSKLIKMSAHFSYLKESEDIINPELK